MRRLVAALVVGLGGCAGMQVGVPPKHRSAMEQHADYLRERKAEERRAELERDPMVAVARAYLPRLVAPRCARGAQLPGTVDNLEVGLPIAQACGLVTREMDVPHAFDAYAAQHCRSLEAGACADRYVAMYRARMLERYPYADVPWVDNHCTAYPDDCATPVLVELQFLNSHNAAVGEAWRERRDLVAAEQARQAAAERRLIGEAIGQAFQGVANSLRSSQPGAVTCSSIGGPGLVTTTCW